VGQVVNLRPIVNRPGERSSPLPLTNRPLNPGAFHPVRFRCAAMWRDGLVRAASRLIGTPGESAACFT